MSLVTDTTRTKTFLLVSSTFNSYFTYRNKWTNIDKTLYSC